MFAQHQRHITTRPFRGKRLSGRGALLDCMRDLISDYRAVLQRKQADDATRREPSVKSACCSVAGMTRSLTGMAGQNVWKARVLRIDKTAFAKQVF